MEPSKYSAAILDANIGSTNVTSEDKIRDMVFNTFETVTKVLQHHCGPYSSFAITHQVGDVVSEPIFTNDGINIVKALSFLNPIQDFARRNIAYIGSRIESKVGDGTTTAMILASSFMKYMSDPKNKELQSLLSQISYSDFVKCYAKTIEALKISMRNDQLIAEDRDVEKVAYCQAYTSSHGDIELSTAIAGLFKNLSKEAWPYIYYYREAMETNCRYRVKYEEDQFVSKVSVMNKSMLNDKLGTAYRQKSVDLFVYTDLLTVGDQPSWQPLEDAIKKAVLEETPLLVLCPDTTDGFTRRTINELLTEDRKHNVAVFCHHMEHPQLNDFRVLALLTKQPDITTKYFILKNVQATCTGHDLVLNNLYICKNDSSINPLIDDPDYGIYKQQVEEIKSIIDQAKEEATYRDTVREITHYVSIYNRLYFSKKWMIVVGGLAYDNTAAMDVLMDTINAVNRSLTEGFTGGANTAFCYALLKEEKLLQTTMYDKVNPAAERMKKLRYHIVKSFVSALHDVYEGISLGSEIEKGHDPVDMIKSTIDHSSSSPSHVLDYSTANNWNLYLLNNTINSVVVGSDGVPSIQPTDLIPEVMSRIGEVCLKFLKTENIISINGVYTPPKKKNWFRRLFK